MTSQETEPLGAQEYLLEVLPRVVEVATPAAGAAWTQPVPAGAVWHLLSYRMIFTTSAAVANRQVSVQFTDGTDVYYESNFATAITAGIAATLVGSNPVAQSLIAANRQGNTIPAWPYLVQGGHTIRATVGNIDAADQFSAVVLSVLQIGKEPRSYLRSGERAMDIARRVVLA